MLNSNFNRRTVKFRLSRSCRGFLAGKTLAILLAILLAASLNCSRAQGTWTQKAGTYGLHVENAVGFSIDNKGYIGTGVYSRYLNFFMQYDPATDDWKSRAPFTGGKRYAAAGFSIGSKGYIGTGDAKGGPDANDFWEYDPATNVWTQKADFGGEGRAGAVGFSIGSKGYIGTGGGFSDFWEYDPATNTWTKKAGFGGGGRDGAVGFSIGGKGYIGTGYPYTTDFWEYDPVTDVWTRKADFGGTARAYAVGFSIGSKGYIGTGNDTKDFWEYNPATDTWTQKADFGGTTRSYATGFSIGSKGYIGSGSSNVEPYWYTDFWEYTPDSSFCPDPTNLWVTDITSTSARLKWDAATAAEGFKVRYRVSGTDEWSYHHITTKQSRILNNLSPNTSYTWEVKTQCTTNPGFSSDWSAKQHFTTAPLRMGDESVQQLAFPIYPNPAEDHATIQFTLAQSSHVCIKMYDVSGKEITTLVNNDLQQGEHLLQINTNHFSKGIYLVRMISPAILRDGIKNQKLIVQ